MSHLGYKHTYARVLAHAGIMEQLMDGEGCWEEGLLRRVKILGHQVLTWCGSYLMLYFIVMWAFLILSGTQSFYCTSCKCLHTCGNQKNCSTIIILVTCMIPLLALITCGYYEYLGVHETEWTPSFRFQKKPPTFIRRHCIRNPCISSIDVILPLEELSALAALPTRFLFSWSVEILVSA